MNYQLKLWYSKRKLFAAQTPLILTFNYANYYAEKYASMFHIQKSQKALRKRPLRLEQYKGGYQGSFKLFIILLLLLLFYKKISHASKSTKITKAQKRNRAKAQNANKGTKIKSSLKKLGCYLFDDLRFCACEEKKQKSLYNGNVGPTKPVKVLFTLYEQKLVYWNRLKN